MPRLVSHINVPQTASAYRSKHNEANPRKPNRVLHSIQSASPEGLVPQLGCAFCDSSSRADPAAESPAKNESGEKLDAEHDEAAADNAFATSLENEVGREVVVRDRDQEPRHGKNDRSHALPRHQKPPSFAHNCCHAF
jgi:hypothetical protein